jgi:hypothetical protein
MKKTELTVEINGVQLDENLIHTLKRWQKSSSTKEKSDPERYIEYLNETQDCLTRIMLENSLETQIIADLLTKLICIKDDLRLLIIRKENIS